MAILVGICLLFKISHESISFVSKYKNIISTIIDAMAYQSDIQPFKEKRQVCAIDDKSKKEIDDIFASIMKNPIADHSTSTPNSNVNLNSNSNQNSKNITTNTNTNIDQNKLSFIDVDDI